VTSSPILKLWALIVVTVVTPVVLSYKQLVTETIPDCTPSITIESVITAVLSNINLPSIITRASFGGISAFFIILLFLVFPKVL
jgi:hypothetical protein